MGHPFATRRGRAFRLAILERDDFTCQMCGILTVDGRTDPRAAVVDHIEPITLSPDRTWDEANCRCICRGCHSICDGIEKRAGPDLKRIVREKLSHIGDRTDWPM